MNKYKQLTKKIAKIAITAAVVVIGIGAVYMGISIYADSVNKQLKDFEQKVSGDNSTLANLRSQMDKSGEAEKRFIAIQTEHVNPDFGAGRYDKGGLVDFLTAASARYNFTLPTTNLKQVKEVPSDKQELLNFPNNEVLVSPHIELKFKAASDVHVFSFLDEMRRSAPGIVRIEKLEMKRSSDLNDSSIATMQAGSTPTLVEVTLEFTWIRIIPKAEKKAGTPGAATPPVTP